MNCMPNDSNYSTIRCCCNWKFNNYINKSVLFWGTFGIFVVLLTQWRQRLATVVVAKCKVVVDRRAIESNCLGTGMHIGCASEKLPLWKMYGLLAVKHMQHHLCSPNNVTPQCDDLCRHMHRDSSLNCTIHIIVDIFLLHFFSWTNKQLWEKSQKNWKNR